MSYFDKLFNRLFADKKSTGALLVHEVLKRTDKDVQQYNDWRGSDHQRTLLKQVEQAYYYKKTNIRGALDVHLFNTAYANGFAVSYLPTIGAKTFQSLFDFLKDKVSDMNYRLVNADRRIIDRDSYVETVEKYYLKPPVKTEAKAEAIDQQYGNIVIEHILIDNKPSYIKLLANVYSDSLYKKALNYNEFMKKLFSDGNESLAD